ncbi:MAG: DEAD/DEAH box helicase [Nitrosopumilus sp.]|nr:DEAD/DEAH box helicase [Nitrosopumilus sp.]
MSPAILNLKFPFSLTNDQENAINAWVNNRYKGSIIYSTGTGKTEIAFECAKRAAFNKCLLYQKENKNLNNFKILFLVPRIILIEQNMERLARYNIDKESIGAFFGEKKDEKEITISTYQSVINNHYLIKNSDMVILDEVHFVSNTAFSYTNLFRIIKEDPKKMILGLTATINELDPKYQEIIKTIPPVRRYLIKEAVDDGRLAKPEIISIEATLTNEEKDTYDKTSELIRNISYKLNAYEPSIITKILYQGGARSKYAKEWFSQVRIRKDLLNSSQNKLERAVQIIRKHHKEKSMIFSETIDSISKLKTILEKKNIPSEIIHSKIKIKERKSILERWGKDFFPLLSVHTLEIGYDIPQVGIAIILSNTSNVNQIAQRIGRVIRKTEAKDKALIYIIYVKETRDNKIVRMVDKAVGKKSDRIFKKTSTQTKITDKFN